MAKPKAPAKGSVETVEELVEETVEETLASVRCIIHGSGTVPVGINGQNVYVEAGEPVTVAANIYAILHDAGLVKSTL